MADRTQTPEFFPFRTWYAVLDHVDAGRQIFYHAPMDARPVAVHAALHRVGKRIRITPPTAHLRSSHPDRADPFWADADHLDRFRRKNARAARRPDQAPILTMREFTPRDHDLANETGRRLGYKQRAYTSTSGLWGYFCLAENPEHVSGPTEQRIIIATEEHGIMVVQDLEDLKFYDLYHRQDSQPANVRTDQPEEDRE